MTTSTMNSDSELGALVKGALLDLSVGPLALADFLQEHGRDKEAVLLRRRWKAWKRERDATTERAQAHEREIAAPMRDAVASLRAAGFQCEATIHVRVSEDTAAHKRHDESFIDYLRGRFSLVRLEDVTLWCLDGNDTWGHVVLRYTDGFSHTACGLFVTRKATRTRPPGVCANCRKAMFDLHPTPRESPT